MKTHRDTSGYRGISRHIGTIWESTNIGHRGHRAFSRIGNIGGRSSSTSHRHRTFPHRTASPRRSHRIDIASASFVTTSDGIGSIATSHRHRIDIASTSHRHPIVLVLHRHRKDAGKVKVRIEISGRQTQDPQYVLVRQDKARDRDRPQSRNPGATRGPHPPFHTHPTPEPKFPLLSNPKKVPLAIESKCTRQHVMAATI